VGFCLVFVLNFLAASFDTHEFSLMLSVIMMRFAKAKII